jgi:hypothetical protein
LALYAALKRRSSTVLRAFMSFRNLEGHALRKTVMP